jgi:hypothetical protein
MTLNMEGLQPRDVHDLLFFFKGNLVSRLVIPYLKREVQATLVSTLVMSDSVSVLRSPPALDWLRQNVCWVWFPLTFLLLLNMEKNSGHFITRYRQ